jgi:RimJ/RimL family protein N-acetyltransferase
MKESTKKIQLNLVECTPNYFDFVRVLRNDTRVLDGFIQSQKISEEMQKKYMSKNSQFYRIALVDKEPVGYVGVINGDIRVCTHPDYQGKGIGKFMINRCLEIWPDAFAKVKIDNEASLRLFENSGFTKKFYILTKD